MRDLRLLLLSGVGVAAVMAAVACATEAQEPGVTGIGPTSGLTSDSGSDTDTDTDTDTSTATVTSTAVVTSGPVTTTTNTTADSDDTSTETATTAPLPLGGTFTSTSAVTTGSAATTGNTANSTAANTASASNTTSSSPAAASNDGMGGMTSFGGFTATNGGGSCTSTPATAPVPLEADDGWVDCSTNDVGIQGEFFTYSDGNGSTITPAFTGDEICVEGTAGQAVSDNSVWGAGLGVNLNQEEREADVETWNANAMGISGFRFALSAMPSGTGLRLVYQSGGTDYCVEITTPGAQTVLFEDTAEACWGSGGDAPNPATLEAVKWQITTNSSEHDFSFCITQLAAIP